MRNSTVIEWLVSEGQSYSMWFQVLCVMALLTTSSKSSTRLDCCKILHKLYEHFPAPRNGGLI